MDVKRKYMSVKMLNTRPKNYKKTAEDIKDDIQDGKDKLQHGMVAH